MSSDTPPSEMPDKPQNTVQTILIADDRYENRYFLQVMLGGSGYQVITADNGQEALEKLKTGNIDAIISDILMPVMDGFKLCRTIHEDPEIAHIPFIFYSASYTEPKDREFGLSLGAAEYVSKPIEPEDFLRIIRRVLDHADQGGRVGEEKLPPDNLSYYTSYADVLGRKLDKTVVESEQHREEARFSEEKYRVFLKNLQGIGYLTRIGEEIPEIFEGQVKEITGYSAIEFLNGRLKWVDIIHPDSRGQYLREKAVCESEFGCSFSHEYRIIHLSGEIRWVHEIATCLPGQDPDTTLIQGAIYDNTLQRYAEEQIRASEERFRTLFKTMAEGVIYLDKNGYISDANPSAEWILGLTLEEMQGRTSVDPRWKTVHEDGSSFPGEDHPAMVALRTGKKNSEIMGILSPRDNKKRWILVHAVPQYLQGEDSPHQVYTTFEDITKEKESRDHIEHLNRILKSLRVVNFLITGETKRETLLRKISSNLAEGGGYPGIWINYKSESASQVFQAISDPGIIGSTFDRYINQENIDSLLNTGSLSEGEIITHSLQTKSSEENSSLACEGYEVMITRLSCEDEVYGAICVCVPDEYVHDPEEKSLFLEIARDIGFALHHITVLHREETARNALSAHEKQYRELVENISDTIFTMNTDGIVTYVSPVISKITGLSPSQYFGRKYLDFIHADDRDNVNRWFRNVILNQSPPVEFRIVNEHNEVQYIQVKATPVRKNGEIVEITGILSDITIWKESEILRSERAKEVQVLLSLHLLTHKTEDEIFTFALQAALEVTMSKVGYIALISEGGKRVDFQVWSPEVEKTCSVQNCSPHMFSSSSGLRFECITKKNPMIINDYPSFPDQHGYPEGHVPIQRFLEVPILDGEQVAAIIAVANRVEPYTDAHAHILNTLGNTLSEIIHRKRSDKEIRTALAQISQNMEKLATLNDTIRNPLTVISLVAETIGEPYHVTIMEAVHDIDEMVDRLDQGWVQSDKVKNFLIKHYQLKDHDFLNT